MEENKKIPWDKIDFNMDEVIISEKNSIKTWTTVISVVVITFAIIISSWAFSTPEGKLPETIRVTSLIIIGVYGLILLCLWHELLFFKSFFTKKEVSWRKIIKKYRKKVYFQNRTEIQNAKRLYTEKMDNHTVEEFNDLGMGDSGIFMQNRIKLIDQLEKELKSSS